MYNCFFNHLCIFWSIVTKPSCSINFSGGSIANMFAMNLARHKRCPDIKEKGLFSCQRLVAFTSEQVGAGFKSCQVNARGGLLGRECSGNALQFLIWIGDIKFLLFSRMVAEKKGSKIMVANTSCPLGCCFSVEGLICIRWKICLQMCPVKFSIYFGICLFLGI